MDSRKLTIFLDIDGPLATFNCWGVGTKNKWGWYMFNPKCVKVLNHLNDEYDIDWILSSDWRNHSTLDTLNEYFEFRGLNFKLKNMLEKSKGYGDFIEERAELILNFVEENNLIHYLVIDDLPLNIPKSNFLHVKDEGGVADTKTKKELYSKVNSILNE